MRCFSQVRSDHHSTETASNKVPNDPRALDSELVSILVLLDLGAAFDSVDQRVEHVSAWLVQFILIDSGSCSKCFLFIQ